MPKHIELFPIKKTFKLGGKKVPNELKCFKNGCGKLAATMVAVTSDEDRLYRENICLCRACAYKLSEKFGASAIADYELSHKLEEGRE